MTFTFYDFITYFLLPFVSLFFVFGFKILSRKREQITYEDMSVGMEILIGNTFILFIEIMRRTRLNPAKPEEISQVLPFLLTAIGFIFVTL